MRKITPKRRSSGRTSDGRTLGMAALVASCLAAAPALAGNLPVTNPSFESPALGGNFTSELYTSTAPDGWVRDVEAGSTSDLTGGENAVGVESPYYGYYGTSLATAFPAPFDGTQLGYANLIAGRTMSLVSSAAVGRIEAGITYDLYVVVGERNNSSLSPVEFQVGLTLGAGTGTAGDLGNFATATLQPNGTVEELHYTFTAPAGDPSIGQAFYVRLRGINSGSNFAQANFDNVSLSGDPIAKFSAPSTVNEGSAATLSFSNPQDVSSLVSFHYAFDCNGGSLSTASYTTSSASASATCTFDDGPSQHTVSGRIIDSDGQSTLYTTLINVANVAPTPSIQGAPASSPEGTAITLTASVSDPSQADTSAGFAYAWSVTKDGNFFASGTDASFSFTPDDNGSYVVSLAATDKDGGTGSTTATIAVANVAPSATFVTPATVDEDSSFALTLADASDPSPVDTAAGFAYAFDCGDGMGFVPASGNSRTCMPLFSVESVTVQAEITDKDGGVSTYSATVAAYAPSASFAAPTSVDEGGTAVLSFSNASDPYGQGLHYQFDCGDGNLVDSTVATYTCAYDDGPATVTVRGKVIDAAGGSALYTQSLSVVNVAPTPSIQGAPATSPEGTAIALTATVTDPSQADTAAGFTYAWSVTKDGAPFATGSSASFSFTPDDNGSYVVSLAATDKDGGTGAAAAQTIAVTNVPPSATFATPTSVDDASSFALTLINIADPSPVDVAAGFAYAFDCGDGNGYVAGAGASRTCAPVASVGSVTVRARITDKDGGASEYTATVATFAPSAVFAGPTSVNEGSTATFTFTDPSDPYGQGLHYQYDCGGGTFVDSADPSYACAFDDGPATLTVRGRVIDGAGGSALYTQSISVAEVAPTATFAAPGGSGSPNSPVTLAFTNPFDPSTADTNAGFHHAFDCAGGALSTATYANSGTATTTTCTFASAGLYHVSGRILDKDGASTFYGITVDIGGRMTGGGALAGGVTHGFTLHCDHRQGPDSLEVNWSGNSFRLGALVSSVCSSDPNLSAGSPGAPFDVLSGTATGTLNGATGYTATFTLTDAGEPGTNDSMLINIVSPTGETVLSVDGKLVSGDQQAHAK